MDFDEMSALVAEGRIQELEEKIRQARHDYYVKNAPTVSDDVYDAWIDELTELKATSDAVTAVGAAPAGAWKKVAHEIPMGSLDKIKTLDELTSWVTKVTSGPLAYEPLCVTEKLDGISISLKYDKGYFLQGVTRGDGQTGEDITSNVVKMQGIPAKLTKAVSAHFRGEVILKKSDLAKHFPDYANARNAAGGIAHRLDGQGCEHLTVLVYCIADGFDDIAERGKQLEMLERLGFKTPNWYVTAMAPGVKTPHDLWVEYQQSKRASLDYDIDGLVVELNDVAKQLALGEKNSCPEGARAFKFAPITRETVIVAIESPTGATGRMTPVAIFNEVNLLGTRVTNASLYNWKYIRDLGIDVGARVLVARANDVIPRVVSVVVGTGTVATPPKTCSSCGAEAVWEGEYLVCPNTSDCPAQALGRLERYIKELNILEWGEAVLERLIAAGLVKSVPDLYKLTKEQLAGIERMGDKSAENLLATLWAKNPIPVESFLGALSIPGCATSTISLVMDAGYDTLDKLRSVSLEQLQAVKGLGPVKSAALFNWLKEHGSIIDAAAAAGVKLEDRVKGSLTGMSFCFTGKTKTKRADLEAMVKAAGGTVKSSVGKGLNYLIMADPSSSSTKAQAAQKNGTKTISEDEFLKLVKS